MPKGQVSDDPKRNPNLPDQLRELFEVEAQFARQLGADIAAMPEQFAKQIGTFGANQVNGRVGARLAPLAGGLLKAPGISAGNEIFVGELGSGEEAQLARMAQRIQAELAAQQAAMRPVVALRVQDADP